MPVDVDVALSKGGELRERGAREVEAVGGAARAKVGHGDGDGLAGVWKGVSEESCHSARRRARRSRALTGRNELLAAVSTSEVLVSRERDNHVRVLERVAAGAVAAVRVVVGSWRDYSQCLCRDRIISLPRPRLRASRV